MAIDDNPKPALPPRIGAILTDAGTREGCVPPTLLYNEGWLLRLALDSEARGIPCLPFRLARGARWYSEALLESAFRPCRRGDPLAEARTHADGVAGHFHIAEGTKSGLVLAPDASQFVVLEAKIFSPLSPGTTRAPGFDQAARTVAAMAETLRRAGTPPAGLRHLGLYLLAPRERIRAGEFSRRMSAASVRAGIEARISAYSGARRAALDAWLRDWVCPLLDRLETGETAWETVAEQLGPDFAAFYAACLRHNAAAARCRGAHLTHAIADRT